MDKSLDTILEKAAEGDQAAWRIIVEAYAPRVFGLIISQCGDPDLAEEVSQSVFCTIAHKISGGSTNTSVKNENQSKVPEHGGYVEQGKFEPWLFRIAVNRLRDEMRRRKRQAAAVESDTLENVTHTFTTKSNHDPSSITQAYEQNNQDITSLREAMQHLSPTDRLVLDMRHRSGHTFREIAEILEQPLGTILARQHRALKKLKSLMEQNTTIDNQDNTYS